MKKIASIQSVYSVYSYLFSILLLMCGAAIAVNMYIVYMGAYNVTVAAQVRDDVYDMRNEIVQIADIGVTPVNIQQVAISHLIVTDTDPVVVSVSR